MCLHGLNSSPAQFEKILKEMQQQDLSQTDIYVPRVLQKGNAKLDDMVQPILEKIKNWTQTAGAKELVLIGVSNGGRIARAIDVELAKSENNGNIKQIRFVSIVGACKGSSLADLVYKLQLSWVMSKNIAEEMPTSSGRNIKLNQDWEEGLKKVLQQARDYTFIASPHDWQVPNYSSTLMATPNFRARYALIKGHGHNSIVNASARVITKLIFNFSHT